MINKLLLIILISFSPIVFSMAKDGELQIKQLIDKLLQKEFELSKLGEEIAAKQKTIKEIIDEGALELKSVENKGRKILAQEINSFAQNMDHCLVQDVKNFLGSEFFKPSSVNTDKLGRIKCAVMRYCIEHYILRQLIYRYGVQWQEILEIALELAALEESINHSVLHIEK